LIAAAAPVLALFALVACSAPAPLPELITAEAHSRDGRVDDAVRAYQSAQRTCQQLRPPRKRIEACTEAQLGEAEALEAAQRWPQAIAAYQRSADNPASELVAATSWYRIGRMQLAAGRSEAAWTALWRCVTRWPDEPSAGDALRLLVSDGRGRNPRALVSQLGEVLTAVAETAVADNLVWSLADLSEHELGESATARALYDRVAVDYPGSGFRDDARWHAARLSRVMGDGAGAVRRLRGLLSTREVALGAGSYFSIWLDDAQLELGRILRDDLGDRRAAVAAFRQLPRDYPASTLIDDSLWELAVTLEQLDDRAAACVTLVDVNRRFADSRYRRSVAEHIVALDCAAAARPGRSAAGAR
jgi:tetratricopeptide (TPR) repeat protein